MTATSTIAAPTRATATPKRAIARPPDATCMRPSGTRWPRTRRRWPSRRATTRPAIATTRRRTGGRPPPTAAPPPTTVAVAARDPRRPPNSLAGLKVSAEEARRFLVARQFVAPARALEGGADGVRAVFRRLGSLQLDPIAVAGLSHDLVLHARVAGYDPAWCVELSERREIVEAYNKGLSLVPAREFPWYRVREGERARKVLADNADVARRVLERIRSEGPLSSADFEREAGSTKDWFG